MILAAYDLFSNGIDILYIVLFGLAALLFLFAPYEMIQKIFPKAASPKAMRICGVILLIITIASLILFIL